MKALLMILIFFPGVLSAQVELDLQLCREMAIGTECNDRSRNPETGDWK